MRLIALLAGVTLLVAPVPEGHAARKLSLQDRVAAQEAIERVTYSWQGAERPFETAVPRDLLERKVQKYLQQSQALEKFWKTPVAAAMLQREVERMARGSRMPDRLRQLYAALGNDPFLVQECLARPLLVDRLTRNFFAFDRTLHGEAWTEAQDLRNALLQEGVARFTGDPRRSLVEVAVAGARAEDAAGEDSVRLSAEEFREWRRAAPEPRAIGPAIEEPHAFVIRSVLEETSERAREAIFTVRKKTWDDWWAGVAADLDALAVVPVASEDWNLPLPQSCLPDDVWDNGSLGGIPGSRSAHTAVWTGTVMVVWGGTEGGNRVNLGARYDPATDTWSPTSTEEAPAPRQDHTAVWTGSRMIVWGGTGTNANNYLNSGGSYDPFSDSWTSISLVGAPSERRSHTAVWTGTSMLVWGGFRASSSASFLGTGGRYDPATDTWTAISMTGAPSPRQWHSAVWTGTWMIVWGGDERQGSNPHLDTGGRYDPATDSWQPTSMVGVPTPRYGHGAVWTGSRMLVWGGKEQSAYANSGALYDPVADSWAPTTTSGAPVGRAGPSVSWTGSVLVVWGGQISGVPLFTGGRYDPALDQWSPTSLLSCPSARVRHSAVWTGDRLIVWGGDDNLGYLNSGARYDPVTDVWTPTATVGAPTSRDRHTAVWTGSRMIVWGGVSIEPIGLGGMYDPVTDTWTMVSTSGEPLRRGFHSAVWTGDRMIVWGGFGGPSSAPQLTGGAYDPIADAWTALSTVSAPWPRYRHTAVWTGTEMLIWGGLESGVLGTGGRYDPVANTWTPISTVGAPTPRVGHSAVWSGSQMIVWGGGTGAGGSVRINTGGRYDPASDSWTPTALMGAPTARTQHSAVWTGSQMVVWGADPANFFPTGGRYDPIADSWQPTSTQYPPNLREGIPAVWTGLEMIVFGSNNASPAISLGGRYAPALDRWVGMNTSHAPTPRERHTAVWTGQHLIVWGGTGPGIFGVGTGGRYSAATCDPVPLWYRDEDGDGYGSEWFAVNSCCAPAGHVAAAGECNDADPAIHPGAVETCDGVDNDCDGIADNASPPLGSPSLLVEMPAGSLQLSWSAVPRAVQYDVVVGDLQVLRFTGGHFTIATSSCAGNDFSGTSLTIPFGEGDLFFLVRASAGACGQGGYDEGSGSQSSPRDPEIAASPWACP